MLCDAVLPWHQAHRALLRLVLDEGRKTDTTVSIPATSLSMRPANAADHRPPRPGADWRIGVYEGLAAVAGVQYPRIMNELGALSDFWDGGASHGAYGPRLRPLLPQLSDQLWLHPASRRHVASIWRPEDLLGAHGECSVKDTPCTLALVFKQNEMTAIMRSQDLWWGMTYDVPMFSIIHASMAAAAHTTPGNLHILCADSHVYHKHTSAAVDYACAKPAYVPAGPPLWCASHGEPWHAQRANAELALDMIDQGATQHNDLLPPWLNEAVATWHD